MKFLKNKIFALNQVFLRLIDAGKVFIHAIVNKNGVTSYWGFNNFGDLITPFYLRELGLTPIHAPRVSCAEFVCVGSILDTINSNFSGVILGSGFLDESRSKKLPKATILAVRGKLTKKLLGINNSVQLGDAGLIISKFVTHRPEKKYRLGIVPHYSDKHNNKVKMYKERFNENVLFIDVFQSPEVVFNQIAMCEYIASSSLHGLVLADSLGIPSLWLSFSDLLGHGRFKFDDYYSAFDVTRTPFCPTGKEFIDDFILLMKEPPECIHDVIDGLYNQLLSWKKTKDISVC